MVLRVEEMIPAIMEVERSIRNVVENLNKGVQLQ